jgi:diguanylate cyclase (GGDEF)-like protein
MDPDSLGSERLRRIELEMKALSSRDLQLWSIAFLILVVLAAGVAALLLPNVDWKRVSLHADSRYLPQLFFGLIMLIALFNVYVLDQRRALNQTRQQLIRQVAISEKREELAQVDPLTHLFNRRFLALVLPKEISRADRLGSTISFLIIDLDDFKLINTRLGHLLGDQLLAEVGQLLRRTFRGSDSVVRYGGDEFLVVMPDTTEEQAQHAVARLRHNVAARNSAAGQAYRIALSCGLSSYVKGADIDAVLRAADERLYQDKDRRKAQTTEAVA